MNAEMNIQTKRVYEPPAESDGYRILVDRLWPRGISKAKAGLDLWDKDAAPSSELRRWWNHDPDTMDEFERRYLAELDSSGADRALLRQAAGHDTVTLLYAAHDPHLNQAVVLARRLRELDAASA